MQARLPLTARRCAQKLRNRALHALLALLVTLVGAHWNSRIARGAQVAEAPEATEPAQPAAAPEPAAATQNDPAAAKRLRFNFRFQKWADVLEWFAEQADLSLVLDAPPPGTFNYSDQREYSPAEALDLLNGVLSTKGYTLVRRDRMLMVVSIEQGVPEGIAPRVPVDELASRGRYEFVSTLFPIGNRNAEEVRQEITPLLGPHGKAIPLLKTQQVLVTDTAGVVRTVQGVIESMPQPQSPAPTTAPGEAEKPLLTVYPIAGVDGDAVIGVLQALLPDAKFAFDKGAEQLSAFTTPTGQAAVKGVIDQIKANDAPDQRPRLEIYEVGQTPVPALVATLLPLVPEARLSYDVNRGKLAAWARPKDHEALAKAIGEIVGDGAATSERQLEVYPMRGVDLSDAVATLRLLVPRATISADTAAGTVVVHANAADQKTVAEALVRLRPEERQPTLVLYPVGTRDAATLTSLLANVVPDVRLAADAKNRRIAAFARPEQHEALRAALATLTAEGEVVEERQQMAAYRLKNVPYTTALQLLPTAFPEARFAAGADTSQLVVWARPDEQELIKQAIEQMDSNVGGAAGRELAVYRLKADESAALQQVLDPQLRASATFYADATRDALLVWAAPDKQQAIAAAIEKLQSKLPPKSTRSVVVYPLKRTTPTIAATVVATAVPTASPTIDAETGSVAVSASQEDHEKVRAAIEQLEGAEVAGRTTQAYEFKHADPSSALYTLMTMVPTARMTIDTSTRRIVASALPTEHEKLVAAIAEIDKPGEGRATTEVYRLEHAEPTTVLYMLYSLAPQARALIDPSTRAVVATASAADHERIREAIGRIDTADAPQSGAEMRVYAVEGAAPSTVLTALQGMFALRRDVQLSVDSTSGSIVAIAPAAQHERIGKVLAELSKGGSATDTRRLEIYSLKGEGASEVRDALQNLFNNESLPPRITVNEETGQLVAMATEKQHETIRQVAEQMEVSAREVEAFQLQVVDPLTAQFAIMNLYGRGGGGNVNPPRVDADFDSQRLFVRGTPEQVAEIRKLLVKMGEPALAATGGAGVRVVPFSGDTEAAVAEIVRVWPKLRGNPIRVVTPSAVIPALKGRVEDGAPTQPVPPAPPVEGAPESSSAPSSAETKPDAASVEQPAPAAPKVNDGAMLRGASTRRNAHSTFGSALRAYFVAAALGQVAAPAEAAAVEDSQIPPAEAQEVPPAAEEATASPEASAPPAPIIISPSDGSITIASDDPEALDQVEALLRSLTGERPGNAGREFAVFLLRNSEAATVAGLLQQLYRSEFSGFRSGGSASIVADERLNAIVVKASPNDTATIEKLIEQLDTAELPEHLLSNEPTIIPVKNANAQDIEDVLRDVYRAQMTAGAARAPLPLPARLPEELASAIQKINAAAAGPLMTISVDTKTNSIVVLAPAPLVAEVRKLVERLDQEAAENPARGVRVLALERTNSKTIKQALDMILRDRGRMRRSGGQN